MDAPVIMAIGSIIVPLATIVIGFFALRYKASAAVVDNLESRLVLSERAEAACKTKLLAIELRMDAMEKENLDCHDERRRILDDLVDAKRAVVAREAELASIRAAEVIEAKRVAQQAIVRLNENAADIKENTQLTEKIAIAVESLKEK